MPNYRGVAPTPTPDPNDAHKEWKTQYAMLYVNDIGLAAFRNPTGIFPVGSKIVREKIVFESPNNSNTSPKVFSSEDLEKVGSKENLTKRVAAVIAMVKREKGFSRKTDDWEFLVINPDSRLILERETKGDCSKCHSKTKATDWVYRTLGKTAD
ncbi:MAG: cytochrome P460 family protein [Pyrinomonadaceae bacterium]